MTEFIPVSSTGHLILASHLLSFAGVRADTFTVFIQSGAILAIVFLYFDRLWKLLGFRRSKAGFAGVHGCIKLALACLPAFVMGALFSRQIKEVLFAPLPVGLALIAGGALMIWAERFASRYPALTSLDEMTYKQSVLVGLFQCLALWPGISRSASTISGGLFLGIERGAAAEFSFLLAVPVIFAASIFDLFRSFDELRRPDLLPFSIGFFVSFVVAIVAVKAFLTLLNRWTLKPFAWYRMGLGVVVIVLL